MPTDSEYTTAIKNAGIAETTRDQYLKILKRIQKLCNDRSLETILESPDVYFKILKREIPNERTLSTTLATILAVYKYTNTKSADNPNYKKWFLYKKTYKDKLEDEAKDSIPRGRAAEGLISWSQVIAAREALAKMQYGSRDHLCLALYTYLAPRRQEDYYRTLVITDNRQHSTTGYSAVLNLHSKPPVLKVLKYKTVKTYDTWEKELTEEFNDLLKVIKHSLKENPRTVLFTQADGEPFTNVIAYTQFTNRVLKKYLGEKVTLNSLRHAASAANLTSAARSLRQQEEYAKDMGHSMATHQLYRYVSPPSSASPRLS